MGEIDVSTLENQQNQILVSSQPYLRVPYLSLKMHQLGLQVNTKI